jgi:hypothetical protein
MIPGAAFDMPSQKATWGIDFLPVYFTGIGKDHTDNMPNVILISCFRKFFHINVPDFE